MSDPEWRRLNRANWDERVAVHLGADSDYQQNLAELRAGARRLRATESELGPVAGMRVLHLQCHFGADSLALAQQGAHVTGIDFSAPAIATARGLAAELGLADRTRFIESDVLEAPEALAEPASFDRVFTTWGTTIWLPDITRWARVITHFLKPGGRFYFADIHPAALVFDDRERLPDGKPGFFAPYLGRQSLVIEEQTDYADPNARLRNTVTHQFIHPLGDTINALITAGLRLDWLHEHDWLVWKPFAAAVCGADGLWRWPDRPWLPLSFSLMATREAR